MLHLQSHSITLFLLVLALTVLVSFVPERLLKPCPPSTSNSLKPSVFMLHILLVTLLFLAVTLIVQRPIFASLAVTIFLVIASGVSNTKYQALREPLVYSDIMMFSQAFKHPRLYFPFLGLLPIIVMSLIIISVIIGVMTLEPAMVFTWQHIVFTVLLMVICFYCAKKLAQTFDLSEDPAVDNAQFGLVNSIFAYAVQAQSNTHKQHIIDTLNNSVFSQALKKHRVHMSKNALTNKKKGADASLNDTPYLFGTSSDNKKHNITVIQSESFFDARRMHSSINPEVLENYDNCVTQAQQFGTLKVPAWGANTMRTEFSFLTGLKYEEMGLYRYYPYQYLHSAPVVSLAKVLQSHGYHCVCIHPHPASFFGRNRIFPTMGFDEFIDIKRFDTATTDLTFGPYISDKAVADKIIEVTKNHDDKPLFIFAITMENHGPLHLEKTTNEEQKQYFSELPMTSINDLTVYLRHLKNADKMIEQLVSHYQQLQVPSTLCFYGDHIPSMPKTYDLLDYKDENSDYFIWSNSDNKTPAKKCNMSAEDLAECLLRHTGNIVDPSND